MAKNTLKDNDLLEYLSTSDFNETLKTEEYKYLLLRFKAFYKMMYGRQKTENSDMAFQINQMLKEIDGFKERVTVAQTATATAENELLKYSKKRKLTWKERFNGEIEKY